VPNDTLNYQEATKYCHAQFKLCKNGTCHGKVLHNFIFKINNDVNI